MASDLQHRMASKTIEELEAIISSPDGVYTDEARDAAASVLATRVPETEEPVVQSSSSPSRGSVVGKILTVLAVLAIARELLRIVGRLFFN